ncbi:FAD-dependent oxidoreductase [Marinomonas sp. 5E14-1]|uniref:NAD(P)/FAD-dependent oxidoreductase n=1 Tax=Marinomonas sp. 5E14-1 TaxID=3153922 RepID=UPI003263774D
MSTQTRDKSEAPIFDIAIVGAGLAGSLSAHLLSESGYKVCVIEKGRGSGGRASSKRIADDISCDLGTPFIYAHQPESKEILEKLVKENIATPWKQCSKPDAQAFVGVPKMSAITRHWLSQSTFITETRIHHIEQVHSDNNQPTWLLRDDKYQKVVHAKKIIITAPAPQAAMILATHADLTVLLLRANQASKTSQPQWAMWLEASSSELNALIEFNQGPIARMIKDNHKPMRKGDDTDRWVIQADTKWTSEHLDSDKEKITQTLLQAFSEHTEQRAIKHGQPHRWLLSRFEQNKDNQPFAWSPEHNIGLAGDWLFQGDAEGAILSAFFLTNAIKDNR